MDKALFDISLIRDLIERWVVYRDALLWDKFRTVWHKNGRMRATWTEGSYEDFIRMTEEGVKSGLNILHILGGSAIEVNGCRATSMTKMIILQRAQVDGILCDVTSYARHFDFWEKIDGRWGLVNRDTICDKDRMDPVDTNEKVRLDQTILNQFPMEYRHLAYLQTKSGYTVNKDVPRLGGGKALEDLYHRGEEWLAGQNMRAGAYFERVYGRPRRPPPPARGFTRYSKNPRLGSLTVCARPFRIETGALYESIML